MAARAQDAADLVERGVGVDEVLDDLGEEDRVGGSVRERQAVSGEFAAYDPGDTAGRAAQRVLRPVDADEAVLGGSWQEAGGGGRGRAVAAADVQDGGAAGAGQGGGEDAGLAAGAGVPEATGTAGFS